MAGGRQNLICLFILAERGSDQTTAGWAQGERRGSWARCSACGGCWSRREHRAEQEGEEEKQEEAEEDVGADEEDPRGGKVRFKDRWGVERDYQIAAAIE